MGVKCESGQLELLLDNFVTHSTDWDGGAARFPVLLLHRNSSVEPLIIVPRYCFITEQKSLLLPSKNRLLYLLREQEKTASYALWDDRFHVGREADVGRFRANSGAWVVFELAAQLSHLIGFGFDDQLYNSNPWEKATRTCP